MWENIIWILTGCGVLMVLVGIWVAAHYWLTPYLDHPDGRAIITGRCGDTMEVALRFEQGRVAETAYWTDGCVYSLNAVFTAANLAKGKDPDDIIEIDADQIQDVMGGLPKDHMHCASLAAETLHAALHDYMMKKKS